MILCGVTRRCSSGFKQTENECLSEKITTLRRQGRSAVFSRWNGMIYAKILDVKISEHIYARKRGPEASTINRYRRPWYLCLRFDLHNEFWWVTHLSSKDWPDRLRTASNPILHSPGFLQYPCFSGHSMLMRYNLSLWQVVIDLYCSDYVGYDGRPGRPTGLCLFDWQVRSEVYWFMGFEANAMKKSVDFSDSIPGTWGWA